MKEKLKWNTERCPEVDLDLVRPRVEMIGNIDKVVGLYRTILEQHLTNTLTVGVGCRSKMGADLIVAGCYLIFGY